MSGSMSQDEINMLITSFEDGDLNGPKRSDNIVPNSTKKNQRDAGTSLYKPIDFRKPNKLQYDNLGGLKQIHEYFAKSLSSYLTMFLRISIQSEVDFELIEQKSYQQYTSIADRNSLWGVFSTASDKKDEGKCFIQVENSFCNFFLGRTFGGRDLFEPNEDPEENKMADINKELSKTLFGKIVEIYAQAWENAGILNFDMELTNVEDNVQNVNLGIISSEMIVLIPIEMSLYQKTDDDETVISKSIYKMGIPYSVIEPVLDKLNLSSILLSHKSDTSNKEIETKIQKMSNVVEVYVGESNERFIDLLNLRVGEVITFNKRKTDPYDVFVGGIKKYKALPYKLGKSVIVKIIE